MLARARYGAALVALLFVACLSDPVGPGILTVSVLGGSADTVWVGAPGERLPRSVRLIITDDAGHPVSAAAITWETTGAGASVTAASSLSDASGGATATWQLGTSAAQEQRLRVTVQTQHYGTEITLRARGVPYIVSGLRLAVDSPAVLRVGDTLQLKVDAIDPYGNVFPAPDLMSNLDDSTIASSKGAQVVGGPRRGYSAIWIGSHGVSTALPVHVTQFVATIVPAIDTVVFASLGAEVPVSYVVRDDRGRQVHDTSAMLSVSDTGIVGIDGIWLRSLQTGGASLKLELPPAQRSVPIIVDQRITSLRLARDTIRFDALLDTTTLHPIARDSLGADVREPSVVFQIQDAHVAQLTDQRVLKSITPGITLVSVQDPATGVSSNSSVIVHPIVRSIAVSPVMFDALGDTITPVVTPLDGLGSPVEGASLSYTVSDPNTIRVSQSGTLRSIAPGQAFVTIRDAESGIATSATVTVQQRITSIALDRDTLDFEALGDTATVSVVGRDRLGAIVADAPQRTIYASSNPSVAEVSPNGVVQSSSNGTALVVALTNDGAADTVCIGVAQRVTALTVDVDSLLFEALHAQLPLRGVARDRRGVPVASEVVTYTSGDTAIARVDSTGLVQAVANGVTQISAIVSGLASPIAIRVAQRPARIMVPVDTVHLTALGETAKVSGTVLDSLGYPVVGASPTITAADTSVVVMLDSSTVQARGNGITSIRFGNGSVAAFAQAVVEQMPDSITVALETSKPIVALPLNSLLPVACTVFDRNGFPIAGARPAVTPSHATIVGATCDDVRANKSGFDTLRFEAGSVVRDLAVVVAVAPIPSSSRGDFLAVDSIPSGTSPWAPSARLVGSTVELYFAAYASAPSAPQQILGNLHRLTSTDGWHFAYDGKMLARDSIQCPSLDGSGIENVAIVPRADDTGWRMFYAGGSFACYGWQVFSAVSDDGRNWTKEPGVRLSNGGPVPPAPHTTPPYPVGEGMYVDQLPSGEYRMIAGTFEHTIPPPNNTWQIAEWRSPDQMNWTYRGTVLTTRDMPPAGQGSVYSPTITEIAPGIWRMIFTADARGTAGSRSALWSAVSIDKSSWQLEGLVVGAADTDLYYATLAGDRLFFIRRDAGGSLRLAVTTLQMP